MNNVDAPQNTPGPVPVPAPEVPAAPVVPAAPPVAPVPGNPAAPPVPEKAAFFKDITLMDVGMIAIFVIAMVASVYSSRQQLLLVRKNSDNTRKDIDELKANVQSAMGAGYQAQ